MLLGVLQLHLSSENHHFLGKSCPKTHLRLKSGAQNPESASENVKNLQKIDFLFLIVFRFYDIERLSRPLKRV